ncbi:MAG: calcium-binding protein, partial [Roseimicrobium sp.]
VLGDEGYALFDNGHIFLAESLNPFVGGNDAINLGHGDNTALGGVGSDYIVSGVGNSVILGDSGRVSWTTFAGYPILNFVNTTAPGVGGNDTIIGGSGAYMIMGGAGSDHLTAAGNPHSSVILGDNGEADYDGSGRLALVRTTSPGTGSGDTIIGGSGGDLLFGGAGGDSIRGGSGGNFIVGDNGAANLVRGDNRNLVVSTFTSTDFGAGGTDSIRSGSGSDVVFGGKGGDFIDGESGNDVLLGDQGSYSRGSSNPGHVTLLVEFSTAFGGSDRILGGGGQDMLFGQAGDDILEGGSNHDSLFGGDGNDRLLGQAGNDILVGGPGADFLDGGPGRDTLYVDFFDVWVGGFPEDIIIGGPAETTGLIIGQITNLLNLFGLSLNDGAAERFEIAAAGRNLLGIPSIEFSTEVMIYAYLLPSEILGEGTSSVDLMFVAWSGFGSQFTLHLFSEMSVPTLIGIGSYLETQWGMILLMLEM